MKVMNIMIRALKLDAVLYEEIEKSEQYTKDSILIAAIVILLSSIGFKAFNVYDIIVAIISISIGIALWTGIVIAISYKMLSVRIDTSTFVNCLLAGFSPMLFNILYKIPYVGFYISVAVFLWTLTSIAVVLKQLLEQEYTSCLILSALGAVFYFIAVIILLG